LSITERNAQLERKKIFYTAAVDICYQFSLRKELKDVKKRKKTNFKDDVYEFLSSNKSIISLEYW
jgi:hypothetical protein